MELDGVIDVEGERFACSTVKGAEDGNGLIMRLYNPGAEPGWLRVGGAIRSLERYRLDETHGMRVGERLLLAPYEIATLRLHPSAAARDPRPSGLDIPGMARPLGAGHPIARLPSDSP